MDIRARADAILHGDGLYERLAVLGRPHIVGSYRMDLMSWNDLDINVENDRPDMDAVYDLTQWLLHAFRPYRLEFRRDFLGFEAYAAGERWNFDIWFRDRESIRKTEAYCDRVAEQLRKDVRLRDAILQIKRALTEKGMYGIDKSPKNHFHSVDIYEAVLRKGVLTPDAFLAEMAMCKD